MYSAEENKALVRRFIEVINSQEWDRLDELVSPDFVRHSYAAGQPGVESLEELKAFLQREIATFPDARETIEDLLAEGDRVAARHRFRGTQVGPLGPYPSTGKSMTAEYIAIYRVEAGRITEAWAEWDNIHGLSQLGHFTPPE